MNSSGASMDDARIDRVGFWTEIKLDIIRQYSMAYASILGKQSSIKGFGYIDGFAGTGTHLSRTTGETIKGSPAIALDVQPEFSHYHFIDMDGKRGNALRRLAKGRENVTVYEGDCNTILLKGCTNIPSHDFRLDSIFDV